MRSHEPVPLEEVYAARERIADAVLHTPLVPLYADDAPTQVFLKLENLQAIGSFKLRGAGNAIYSASERDLETGVWTASAGNMALAVAWYAHRLGIRCSVVVPDDAPAAKLAAVQRLGARTVKVGFSHYQEIQRAHAYEEMQGLLIHPFGDRTVMAGNGTIGLEILEDLPDVDAVVIPYGGGGLSCGIASALRSLKPSIKVYASEVNTAAPLRASLAAGRPTQVGYTASFVSGMGAPFVFPEMWPLASQLLDGSLVVTLAEVASAIKLMAERNHVFAEGAGAVPVAAALSGQAGTGRVVCVVSGGNLDIHKLISILQGTVPL